MIAKNLEWKKKTKGDSRTPCFGIVASLVGDDDDDDDDHHHHDHDDDDHDHDHDDDDDINK